MRDELESDGHFREVNCSSVDEFLSVLLPHSGRAIWKDRHDWLFRGQRDATWPLRPSALRPEGERLLERIRPSIWSGGIFEGAVPHVRRNDELLAILRFTEYVDKQGYPVDSSYHDWARTVRGELARVRFPEDGLLQMAALAQHHGVPTRLLDWSESATTATYFAVSDAIGWFRDKEIEYLKPDSGQLDVWAVSLAVARQALTTPAVRMFSVPRYSNPNLAAQKGWFSIVDDPRDLRDGTVACLDEVIAGMDHNPHSPWPLLWKITLPWHCSNRLLGALTTMGVSGASVFPGREGAARALLEERDAVFNPRADDR